LETEGQEIEKAIERAKAEYEQIGKTIDNLLDNITAANRSFVDKRLDQLNLQRQQLQSRIEELERVALSQAEIDAVVKDGMTFLTGLEFTFQNGLPQEKRVALQQCISRIRINLPHNHIQVELRTVPTGNLQTSIIRMSR
jgi:chromosome segregation ATPase